MNNADGSKLGISFYGQAYMAAQSETTEATELARRWKRLYLRYANLSERYYKNIKQFQALRLEPEEMERRYDAVDTEFDEVSAEMKVLYADLEKWTVQHVEINRTGDTITYSLK